MKNKNGKIIFKATRIERNEDAPFVRLKTINDIFNVVTIKNIDDFLEDFKMVLIQSIASRDILKKKIEEIEGIEFDNKMLKISYFEWSDDKIKPE